MQNDWWRARAVDMQEATDKRDFKTFYQSLKAVYGPKYKASLPIKSKECGLLTEPVNLYKYSIDSMHPQPILGV